MSRQPVVCLDFDGVIHDPYNRVDGHKMGQPVGGAWAALVSLNALGAKVVVSTARPDVAHVRDWLRYFGFEPYVAEVTHEKPRADVYVDDQAIRFVEWTGSAVNAIVHAAEAQRDARRR